MAETRSNNFEIILYPESLPDYWIDYIEDTKVPVCVSPVHNLDKYTRYDEIKAKKLLQNETDEKEIERLSLIKEGVIKKPHMHCIVCYGARANKSIKQVQDDFCIPLNAKKYPNFIKTLRGTVRYLIHIDHPNKAQYRLDEIRSFNGFDFEDFFQISNKQLDSLCVEICVFIDENHISDYFMLEQITRVWAPWHKYVCGHSMFFDTLFKHMNGMSMEARELLEYNNDVLQAKVLDTINNE